MSFYRKNWYYIGGIIFVVLSFVIGFFGGDIDPIRKILLLSFMALLVHQFEEYALPGGFPPVWNIAISGEKNVPDRYPLNKQSSLFVNTFLAYTFYVLPIIFPKWYWLGIMTMAFGFAQFIIHGIIINIKLKSFYNPGLAAVIFLHIPIGIYYLWYLHTNNSVDSWHWWVGICGLPIAAVLIVQVPLIIFKDKNSPYPWTKAEMDRFSVIEKLEKIKD
ncbi:HXXEE domain-containing protein [Paenibacillus pseudetheri]|uniref:HXXEE domain-containing protein n=1 Tax=Paenibacillus pseudetheri TaxID=2897682 RepID=A0ABM9BLF7_9BACL|nr:HXXEE domain-containing protein [Paenibacillus pseudetheri]CAH1059287.1 hypothetical protein PAECIP111894_05493 [Paenibacillus pseudetheri]